MSWILPVAGALVGLWLLLMSIANALQTSTAFTKPRSIEAGTWFSFFVSFVMLILALLCFRPIWHHIFG